MSKQLELSGLLRSTLYMVCKQGHCRSVDIPFCNKSFRYPQQTKGVSQQTIKGRSFKEKGNHQAGTRPSTEKAKAKIELFFGQIAKRRVSEIRTTF